MCVFFVISIPWTTTTNVITILSSFSLMAQNQHWRRCILLEAHVSNDCRLCVCVVQRKWLWKFVCTCVWKTKTNWNSFYARKKWVDKLVLLKRSIRNLFCTLHIICVLLCGSYCSSTFVLFFTRSASVFMVFHFFTFLSLLVHTFIWSVNSRNALICLRRCMLMCVSMHSLRWKGDQLQIIPTEFKRTNSS